MIITMEQQASRMRRAQLQLEISLLLAAFAEKEPKTTIEEVLAALNEVQGRNIMHLLAGDTKEGSEP